MGGRNLCCCGLPSIKVKAVHGLTWPESIERDRAGMMRQWPCWCVGREYSTTSTGGGYCVRHIPLLL